jgi:6-phosphofructokinase 1
VILLPEIPYDVARIAEVCRAREARRRSTLICIAEGAAPIGGALTVHERVTVGGGDAVRLGGVGHALRPQLQPLLKSEVRTTVLGHVQRGGSPTAFDRVLATQFGHHAVNLLRAGHWNEMVALQDGRLTSVPLVQVAGQNRTVPLEHPLLRCAREIGVCFGETSA